MSTNERRLLLALVQGIMPRKAPGNHKQNCYYLEKWCKQGWYEYGVSLDLGWLTEAGKRAAQEVSP